jgi:hypothetical protein
MHKHAGNGDGERMLPSAVRSQFGTTARVNRHDTPGSYNPISSGWLWAGWDDDVPPRRRAHKKNTRRWCKGKVGREHVPQITGDRRWLSLGSCRPAPDWWPKVKWRKNNWDCRHREVCVKCGKVLREGYELAPQECPVWRQRYPMPD